MKKRLPWIYRSAIFLLIVSFLVGCSAPGVAPTAAPTAAPPTNTPLPSATPPPPTPTPLPPTDTPPSPTDTPTPLPPTATETPPPTATATLSPTATTAPAVAGSVVPAASGSTITIYFIQLKTGGPVACGDSAFGVSSGVKRTGDTARNVAEGLRVLFATKSKTVGTLYNPLYQSNIKVDRVSLDDSGLIWVYLRGTYKLPKDDCDNLRVKAQIWLTIRQFSDVKSTNIFLNDIPFGDRVSNDK
jgi:hypothetical protein